MERKRRLTWLASGAALAVGIALLVAACGGGGGKKASPKTTSGKTFANFRVTWDEPDYMDPGLAYTVAAWQVMWNVHMSLLGYKHVAGDGGTKLIPYLAQSMPTISSNGTVYKFTLRPGLKYSNGKPVKASDFLYTIKRDYLINSPGVGFFSPIVGADNFGKTKKGTIPGIVVNDAKRTITVKLSHPEGDMENILATLFAAFVPTGTPNTDQSTKGIPATGPYMVTSYTPMRGFVLKRNPNWSANNIPGVPKGNPDKVTATMITDGSAALQSVLSGRSDYDFITVPNDRLPDIQKKYSSQLKIYTSPNTYYYFMNFRVPPFNKLEARQAVNYAIDRNAIAQTIFAGLAKPTQNILPPNYPQYKKIDFYTYDLNKAKQLVQKSGTKGMKIVVYGDNTPPSATLTQYLSGQLNKIGWKATPKLLSHGVYFTTIGNQATKAQAGFTDWFQDYPNPIDWFDVLFNGERITPTHNNNYSNVDIPDINKRIDSLKQKTGTNSSGWASVDHDLVVKYAAAAPYANRQGTDFFGSKVDTGCYVFHVLYQFDFSQICMK